MASKPRNPNALPASPNSGAPSPHAASAPARPHAGLIGASVVLGAIALFLSSASLREIFVAVNHVKFVPDEAEILNWDFAPGRASDPRARVVSSGEEIQINRYFIMDLDQAKALEREGKLEGHRTPVFYFPPVSPWSTVDSVVAFRVQSPEQFELGFSIGLPLSNLVLAIFSVLLFKRGLRRSPGRDRY